jgi:hypothetical protein
MDNNNYMSFLGEGQEVLDSQECHKVVPRLLGGLVIMLVMVFHSPLTPILSLILLWVSQHVHAFVHTPIHAFIHLICSLFHTFGRYFAPFFLALSFLLIYVFLGKGRKMLKKNHGLLVVDIVSVIQP